MAEEMDEIMDAAKKEPCIRSRNGVLAIWEHKGKFYLSGLFKMMDQEGFPLADSLIECKKRNLIPCLDQFVSDALRAGWPRLKAETMVRAAIADAAFI